MRVESYDLPLEGLSEEQLAELAIERRKRGPIQDLNQVPYRIGGKLLEDLYKGKNPDEFMDFIIEQRLLKKRSPYTQHPFYIDIFNRTKPVEIDLSP